MGAKFIIWLVGGSETPPLHRNSPECRGWSETIPHLIPNLPQNPNTPEGGILNGAVYTIRVK